MNNDYNKFAKETSEKKLRFSFIHLFKKHDENIYLNYCLKVLYYKFYIPIIIINFTI